MKKIYLLVSTLFLGMFSAVAQQQFENGGFESWENLGLASEEPTEWSSLKTADALASQAPKVLTQDAGRTGVCIKLTTGNAFGINANGILTNGRVHADFNPELGYVYTQTSDSKWNTPFTSFPDSIVGYFKFAPSGTDKGKVEVILHTGSVAKLPENGTAGSQVARARYDVTTTTSSWIRFSAPFHYYNNNTPAYMLCVITCGDSTITNAGTIAWYDDFQFIYNTITTGSINPLIYNVTNNLGTSIAIPFTVSSDAHAGNQFIAQLSDKNGSFSHPINLDTINAVGSGTINTMIPAQTAPGTGYRVRVIATDPAFKMRGIVPNTDDITVNLTGNYITPDNQALPSGIVGQDSITFTVYETVAATSREWFIGDSSGLNFQSFPIAQTSVNMIYNPASKGYATIVCASKVGVDSLISNKVLVYFGQLGLMQYDAQKINAKVYQSNESIVISSNEKVHYIIFDANGKKVAQSANDVQQAVFTPNQSGLYFVQISTGKAIDTRKIIFNK
jgi:hypothetical protein